MEKNSIDKTFHEASKTAEEPETFPGFDPVWDRIEKKLDKKEEKRKKMIPAWMPYGMAASILIGSGIFYRIGQKEKIEAPQQEMVKNRASPKTFSANIPEHLQKTDRAVKVNTKNKNRPFAPADIAYHKVPGSYTQPLSGPVDKWPVAQAPYPVEALSENKLKMDSVKRQNIEETIAMGIKKQKPAMVNTLSALSSSSQKKMSEMNAVADTAEAAYPAVSFNRKNPAEEPEILTYYKGSLSKKQSFSRVKPGLANRIGNKEAVNLIQGYTPGVNINSISGVPGSGKVDSSITIRGTAKTDHNPLYIINGTEADPGIFGKIDPGKIESIQVFKGDKAISLFGGKAANGAIVIVTKDISKKEKRKLQKLLKEQLPEK